MKKICDRNGPSVFHGKVKDSSMAILCFVCLLNSFIAIKISIMTNIFVVLKLNEIRPITTSTTTTINTTSAIPTNTNTTSFAIAIHFVLAHREQISAVGSRSSCVALLLFLGTGWRRGR
jgi:hypothetical protein